MDKVDYASALKDADALHLIPNALKESIPIMGFNHKAPLGRRW